MFGSISIVTAFGILSQFVGFFRMAIIAAALGLSAEVDAYYLALTLPTLTTMVAGNWVQLVYLGRYTTLLVENRQDLARALRFRTFLVLMTIATLIALIWHFFPQQTLSIFLQGERVDSAAPALKFLGLMIVPVIAADFMGQSLNGHHRYALAAFAPFANAMVATISLWLWPSKGLSPLVWSLLLGAATQLAVVTPTYLELSRGQTRSREGLRAETSRLLRLSLPLIPAIILSNAMFSILQLSVSRLGDGAVAIMAYANRINAGLGQLLVMGMGTVLLPYFATIIARNQPAAQILLFRKLARVSTAVCCLVIGIVYSFGEIGLSVLFERGAFSTSDVQSVAGILFVLSLSLLPLSMGTFIARYFAATTRTDLIAWSGVVGFTATIAVAAIGVAFQNLTIIAAAPVLSFSSTAVFWLSALSTKLEIRRILWDVILSFSRACAIVIPTIFLDSLIALKISTWPAELGLITRGSIMVCTVFLIAYLSKTTRWIFSKN